MSHKPLFYSQVVCYYPSQHEARIHSVIGLPNTKKHLRSIHMHSTCVCVCAHVRVCMCACVYKLSINKVHAQLKNNLVSLHVPANCVHAVIYLHHILK